ncbi:MAG: lipoprotein [Burkholderiaceae bacterium]|nr:lipoprotein [Burkholderiaceae bacterium]
MTLSRLLALLSIGLFTAACGQKGPLVLPNAAQPDNAASAPAR